MHEQAVLKRRLLEKDEFTYADLEKARDIAKASSSDTGRVIYAQIKRSIEANTTKSGESK